jgi:hypothetical protein
MQAARWPCHDELGTENFNRTNVMSAVSLVRALARP